jgi:spore germination protein YaaH
LLNDATGPFSWTRSNATTNKPSAFSMESSRTTILSKKQAHGPSASAKVQSKAVVVSPSSPSRHNTWSSNTESMSETAELAKALWREMRAWFLTFVFKALDIGFHMFEDQHNVHGKGSSMLAAT